MLGGGGKTTVNVNKNKLERDSSIRLTRTLTQSLAVENVYLQIAKVNVKVLIKTKNKKKTSFLSEIQLCVELARTSQIINAPHSYYTEPEPRPL